MGTFFFDWNGEHLPEELAALPPGRYVVVTEEDRMAWEITMMLELREQEQEQEERLSKQDVAAIEKFWNEAKDSGNYRAFDIDMTEADKSMRKFLDSLDPEVAVRLLRNLWQHLRCPMGPATGVRTSQNTN